MGVLEATNAEKTDNRFLKTNILGHFSIQIAENAWKRPIFDTPYLCNRLELGGKWAHFEKKMSRATTYVKTKKIWDFDPDPGPVPLSEVKFSEVTSPPKIFSKYLVLWIKIK